MKNNMQKIFNISSGLNAILLPKSPAEKRPAEAFNGWMNKKYQYAYVVHPSLKQEYKELPQMCLNEFFNNQELMDSYINMKLADHNVMPYEEDGWLRARHLGLRQFLFKQMPDFKELYINEGCKQFLVIFSDENLIKN